MSQSLARVLLHIVFSTKHRYPFLADDGIRKEMHAYLGGSCNGLDCCVLTVGGGTEHVHILCSLSRNRSIADLVGELKRNSSKWAKTKGGVFEKFAWQSGYGAFSVSEDEVGVIRGYIGKQTEHHVKKSFQEEFREFLVRYGVSYDERFLWD